MAVTIATPANYWIGSNALSIFLNALGEPNRVQASVASGAQIMCYVRGIKPASYRPEDGDETDYSKNGDGLEYDNGHNYRRWPLTVSPTYFNDNGEKYLYAAIPRQQAKSPQAMIVFPDRLLDIYGYEVVEAPVKDEDGKMHDAEGNETTDAAKAVKEQKQGRQIGTDEYWYICLQGIITATDGTSERQWKDGHSMRTGTLSTDEAIAAIDEGRYLRKDQDDETPFSIAIGKDLDVGGNAHVKGSHVVDGTLLAKMLMQVGEHFVTGLLGEGGVFRKDADGKTYIEADKMYIRMKAYFDSVEIREYNHSAGNRVASPAGARMAMVVPYAATDTQGVRPLADDMCYHWTTEQEDPETGETTVVEHTEGPYSHDAVLYYRCYFRAADGEDSVSNDFTVGDMAYCHVTNGTDVATGLQQKHYWRLVTAKGEATKGQILGTDDTDRYHFIDLSNRQYETIGGTEYSGYQQGSDYPEAQDDVVQLGSVVSQGRRGAVVEYVSGTDAPSYQVYQNIGDTNIGDTTGMSQSEIRQAKYDAQWSLNGKSQVALGYNSLTDRAYMNVYGDAYIGDRNRNAYMQYHIVDVPVVDPETGEQVIDEETGKPVYRQEPRLDIKARISVQSTVSGAEGGDQTFEEYINSRSVSKETIMKLIGDDLQAIQNQIDGAIETWFYNGVPSANTLPESEWKATDTEAGNNNERLKHLGDLYYDNKTGRAYRYVNTGTEQTPVFSWTEINDSAVVEALKKAQDAQSTADGKRRVFVVQPTPPYDKGDLWVNATFDNGTIKYDDDILKCVTAKDKNGSFSIADWTLASKYTDDSSLNTFLNGQYKTDLQATRNQIDGKAETWYQSQDPSTAWTTDKLQESHVGDLWYNTTNKKTYIYRDMGASANPRYKWAEAEMDVPQEVFDKIDGKASIYTNTLQNPPTNYKENDLWIIPADYNINGVDYKKGEVLTATADSVGFNQAHWTKKVRYTDDAKFDGYINQILNGTGASGDSAIVANAIKAIKGALKEDTIIDGGLVLSSLINLRSNNKTWAGISGQYDASALGGGIAAWYGGGMIDHEYDASADGYAKSIFRFDGSGYLAGGNITWDKNGSVTIKNIHTLYGEGETNILQQYTKLSNMFDNSTWGSEVRIQPLQAFDHLNLVRGTGSAHGDQNYFSITDNSVLNFGEMKSRFMTSDLFWMLFDVYSGGDNISSSVKASGSVSGYSNVSIKAKFGFWSDGFISALGKNDSSSDVALNEPLLSINNGVYGTKAAGTAIVWDGSKWVYGKTGGEGTVTAIKVGNTQYTPTNGVVSLPAYPTSLAWGNITGKPTTIGDYGITDAKIENGVITLGTNTITPLTDAKIKNDYTWWGQKFDASGKVNGNMVIYHSISGSSAWASDDGAISIRHTSGSRAYTIGLAANESGYGEIQASQIGVGGTSLILQKLGGNVGIGTTSPYTNLDVSGGVKATKFYFYKPNAGNDANAVYIEYISSGANKGVHLVGDGFYSDSFVSALGKSDSGSSSVFDEEAMWQALGTNRTNKLIASAYLGNVTKTLTITSGNSTVVYDGTVARSITINDMAAKQLAASTIDGTAGSFFFYGDNLINNQYDWVGIQVDNANKDRGQLVWDSGSISVRQNDGGNWTDWALVLTNKNYASQIAAGTITNAMLAGSIANSKLANSSVTVNGTSVSLGGSMNTANITAGTAGTSSATNGGTIDIPYVNVNKYGIVTGYGTHSHNVTRLSGSGSYAAWGQTYWSNGVPNNISGRLHMASSDIYWKENDYGDQFAIAPSFSGTDDSNLLQFQSAVGAQGTTPTLVTRMVITGKNGYVGIGTTSPSTLLHVNGYTRTNRLYLQSDSVYFELDASGNVHLVGAGFYSDSFISALGKNDSGSGGGVTLNEPLASINSSSLGSPSGHTNSTLVYNGSSWVWSNSQGTTITSYSITGFSGSFTTGNFTSLTVGNKAVATQEWVINKYLPLSGGTMTGDIISKANGLAVRMDWDSANAKTGLAWYNANGDTLLGGIQFFNTSERLMLNATGVSDMWNDKVGNYTFIVGNNELKYNTYDVLHSGNYSTYIDKYVAKAGDTMTGGLTINYNNGTALSVNGAYSLSGVGTLSGLNLTASASQGITFKSSSTGRVLLGMDWYTNSAGTLTVSNSTDNSGIFSYGGFKKSGSSDSYVLLGGGGHKALSEIGGGLTTSYVTSSKENLSSYWVKAWDMTIKDRKNDDLNMTILVQSEYNNLRGIICIRIRQEGTNNSGSYNFGTRLTQMSGNIPNDRFRLYYNNSTGKCELWCNVNAQYGVFNFSVLKKCWRTSTDVASLGTFYNTNFSSVQTLPTSASGYAYTVMGSNDASNMKLTNIDAYASNNGVTSTQTATSICVYDKNNLDLSGIKTLVYANGAIATKWYVRNYTSAGAQATENAITMNMTKSGAVTYVVNNADKFREAIGVNLDNYLPKSGGTLTGALTINSTLKTTGSITIDNESQTIYRIPRKGTTTSGWAWQPISFVGNDNSEFFKIGMFGSQNTFSYAYIGTKAYDGANLRLGSDNSVSPGGHVYLRGAVANSSTGNTTQIVFGTSSDNHVALTSNRGAFIINPSTSGYTNQIVLSVTGNSYFSGSHNVGIGTTSPAYKLHVNGSAYATSLNIDGGIDITRYNPSSGVYVMRFYTLSNASIDVNTGSGTASINKAWSVGSDMRLKNVWRHFDIDVNSVAKAPLFTYRLKSGGSQLMVGTSAQYWMEKIPETVTTGYDGYYSLDYNGVLTASVISVARKVVDHDLRIKQLQDRVIELENELKQLKAA